MFCFDENVSVFDENVPIFDFVFVLFCFFLKMFCFDESVSVFDENVLETGSSVWQLRTRVVLTYLHIFRS